MGIPKEAYGPVSDIIGGGISGAGDILGTIYNAGIAQDLANQNEETFHNQLGFTEGSTGALGQAANTAIQGIGSAFHDVSSSGFGGNPNNQAHIRLGGRGTQAGGDTSHGGAHTQIALDAFNNIRNEGIENMEKTAAEGERAIGDYRERVGQGVRMATEGFAENSANADAEIDSKVASGTLTPAAGEVMKRQNRAALAEKGSNVANALVVQSAAEKSQIELAASHNNIVARETATSNEYKASQGVVAAFNADTTANLAFGNFAKDFATTQFNIKAQEQAYDANLWTSLFSAQRASNANVAAIKTGGNLIPQAGHAIGGGFQVAGGHITSEVNTLNQPSGGGGGGF